MLVYRLTIIVNCGGETVVKNLCAERDSNPRSPKAARLQRAVFDHSTIGALT